MMTMDENHPWNSAVEEFKGTTRIELEQIGKQIGKDAQSGNEQAKAVIKHYEMLYRSFDPITYMQLKEALEAYKEGQNEARV